MQTPKIHPKFICFEGGDGSGKSTLIKKVEEVFLKKGIPYLITREPGGVPIGEAIRNILLHRKNTEMDLRTEALLFAAARRQHMVEKVLPALEEDKFVLMDRFIDSSIVYQGYARGIGMKEVEELNLFATEGLYPSLVFFLDIPVEVAMKRIENNQREQDRLDLEANSFHEKVREGYFIMAKKRNMVILNGERTPEELLQDVVDVLSEKKVL